MILTFPHLPHHKPMPVLLAQNYAQAEEHLRRTVITYGVLDDFGRSKRRESLTRWNLAREAFLEVRVSEACGAV